MNKREEIMVYDIKSLPSEEFYNVTAKQILELYQKERIVLWDSGEGGSQPQIFNVDKESPELFIVDLASTQLSEQTRDRINKAIKGEIRE